MEEGYYIVRSRDAGVFAGEIVKRESKEVTMKNARRIWYWSGAASLSQLAVDGTSNPNGCKFPCEVSEVVILEACEILTCTEKAKESIKAVAVWRQ